MSGVENTSRISLLGMELEGSFSLLFECKIRWESESVVDVEPITNGSIAASAPKLLLARICSCSRAYQGSAL